MSDATPPAGETPAPPSAAGEALLKTTDIGANHIVCPHCETANRLDVTACVKCGKDLSMLRVIANKARHHFNLALEHAERRRWDEAVGELRNCLELDSANVSAWVVLGTSLAKLERFDEAKEAWERALAIDPRFAKAHDYIGRVANVGEARRYYRRLRNVTGLFLAVLAIVVFQLYVRYRPDPLVQDLRAANLAYHDGNLGEALGHLDAVLGASPRAEVQQAAISLSNAINESIAESQREIGAAQQAHDWARGIAAAGRLRALNPTTGDVMLATRVEAEFAGRLVEQAAADRDRVLAGQISADAVRQRLLAQAELMPTPALREEILGAVASVEAAAAAERAAAFGRLIAALPAENPHDRLSALVALAPAWTDQVSVETLLGEAAAAVVAQASAEWTQVRQETSPEAISAWAQTLRSEVGSPEFAGQALDQMRTAFPDLVDAGGHLVGITPLAGLLVSAEAVLPRVTFESGLARAQSLAEGEEWTSVREALSSLDLAQAASGERAQIESLTSQAASQEARARRRAATRMFERWLDHDGEYESRRLSEELARETVDNWEQIVADVPSSLYGESFRTTHCLMYAGRAWERLGDPGQARTLYERVLAEYPSSERAAQVRGYLDALDAAAAP